MAVNWTGVAFNQVPDSANEIHGDKIAKDLGFTGGLVPGVTVSAYLIHPAIDAWGLDWLEPGSAHVKVDSPLYDNEKFEVEILSSTDSTYEARLIRPDGTISATAEVALPELAEAAPVRRGDEIANKETPILPATPENMQKFKKLSMAGYRKWAVEEFGLKAELLDEVRNQVAKAGERIADQLVKEYTK